MLNQVLILIGKTIKWFSIALNLGGGSTWPGHIALNINKNFIHDILKNSKTKTVLIAGTNGKTTTSKLIQNILETNGNSVFRNSAGANLLNGIASSIVLHSSILSKLNYDYAIFEVDENTLPLALNDITPDYVIILNIFRDQLDRYGETDIIAKKWQSALAQLGKDSILILNADDPQIANLGENTSSKTVYFGLNDKTIHQSIPQHAVDSVHCPQCSSRLHYETVYFSHLGDWKCTNCSKTRPKLSPTISPDYPLPGIYNRYNTHAAILLAETLNISPQTIRDALKTFKPAFGRQEELLFKEKRVKIFLSKNPTSFNESLRTINELKSQHLLLVLNDRIPDGRDVSWIWDIDTEGIFDNVRSVTVSGDRCYDMGLRIKYAIPSEFQISLRPELRARANFKFQIEEDVRKAITLGLEQISKAETLYILPTYSAMLETRKILTGKKLL